MALRAATSLQEIGGGEYERRRRTRTRALYRAVQGGQRSGQRARCRPGRGAGAQACQAAHPASSSSRSSRLLKQNLD